MRYEAALDDFVVELEVENLFLLVPEFLNKRHEVRGIDLTGVQRHTAGQIGDADDFHAIAVSDFVINDAFDVAAALDGNPRAVLFKAAGPERAELVGNVMGSRKRLALALDTDERELLAALSKRLARLHPPVKVSSQQAPVQRAPWQPQVGTVR